MFTNRSIASDTEAAKLPPAQTLKTISTYFWWFVCIWLAHTSAVVTFNINTFKPWTVACMYISTRKWFWLEKIGRHVWTFGSNVFHGCFIVSGRWIALYPKAAKLPPAWTWNPISIYSSQSARILARRVTLLICFAIKQIYSAPLEGGWGVNLTLNPKSFFFGWGVGAEIQWPMH